MSARKRPRPSPDFEFTLEELVEIRGSIGALLDIVDEELDDLKNQQDLDINRTRWLNQHIRCSNILKKIAKQIEARRGN